MTIEDKFAILKRVAQIIERGTGIKWRITSFIRNSPSHHNGNALDIAPVIDDRDRGKYAAYALSDPILTKRRPLIRRIRNAVKLIPRLSSVRVGVFLETDHIHIGLFAPDGQPNVFYVWEKTKPNYPDTDARHEFPPFEVIDDVKGSRQGGANK